MKILINKKNILNLKNKFQFRFKARIQAIAEEVKGHGLKETIW